MKISPIKRVMRFSKKGKLSPSYVVPYELAPFHQEFHVPMLNKCIGYPVSILPSEGLGVDENLTYEKVLVEISNRQVKRLRNEEVASEKVFWRNHLAENATWEAEADMMSPYPHLFHHISIQT